MILLKSLIVVISAQQSFSFIWGGTNLNAPLATLEKQTKDRQDTVLDINFQLGKENGPQLSLKGLKIELSDNRPDFKHPKLPGITGPHPKTSSGPRALQIRNLPFYVGMDGQQEVKMDNGSWEMVWREGSPSGSIVCAFEVPEGAQRNEAKLSTGDLFLTLALWSRKGLSECQRREQERKDRAKAYLEQVQQEVTKIGATANLFAKAFHFRNAMAAREKYDMTAVTIRSDVPSDEQIIMLDEELALSTVGTVWTKAKSFPNAPKLLGKTKIRLENKLLAEN